MGDFVGNSNSSSPTNSSNNLLPIKEMTIPLAVFMESSKDAIYVCSPEKIVLCMNPAAESLFGFSSIELIGISSERLIPRELIEEWREIFARIKRGERCDPFETVRITKSGTHIDVSLSLFPVQMDGQSTHSLMVIAREKSTSRIAAAEQQYTNSSEEHRSMVLETVRRVALDILLSRSGVEPLSQIAEAARTIAGAQYAALGVARQDGAGLQEFFAIGMSEEQEKMIGSRPKGVGILGLLLQRTEPLRIDVLAKHSGSVGFPANHPPMDSFLGVPIRRGKEILGSLYLTNKIGGGSFTAADETAVQGLSEYAAVTIYYMQMMHRQRALASSLITNQEEERRALAYDLHDGLTQFVMAAHAHLEAFRAARNTGKIERADRELDQGLKYLKEAVVESRRLISGLRSLALDDLGLTGALEQLISEEKLRSGWITAEFVHNIDGRRFDKSLETTVYRVVQEALTNAHKHAVTEKIQVILWAESNESTEDEKLRLEVKDWGNGFSVEQHGVETSGVGLQGMAERVRLMRGAYHLESAFGEGTLIRAIFPALQQAKKSDWGET